VRALGGLAEGCRKEKGKYFDPEEDHEHVNYPGGGWVLITTEGFFFLEYDAASVVNWSLMF